MFGKAVILRGEISITDLALNLSLGSVVAVEVWHWSVTAGTGAVLRDSAFLMPGNRLDLLVVPVFKVGDEKLPVPFTLVELNFREIISFELLVLWRMGVIVDPLSERDISAEEHNQPAVLLIEVLN